MTQLLQIGKFYCYYNSCYWRAYEKSIKYLKHFQSRYWKYVLFLDITLRYEQNNAIYIRGIESDILCGKYGYIHLIRLFKFYIDNEQWDSANRFLNRLEFHPSKDREDI